MNIQPLWPIAVDDTCGEHDHPLPCAKCDADADWWAQSARANDLYKQADAIESMTLSSEEDRQALRDFANGLRKQADAIRLKLSAGIDREAYLEEREREGVWEGMAVWK